MRQIVCLSTSNWHPYPTRKQQVMSRMKQSEILYFDPPVTYLAPLKSPDAAKKAKAYKNSAEKVQENISVLSMPPVLPFYNKYRPINRMNQKKLGNYVNLKIKEAGFENPVLWVYSPMYADIARHIPHKALIYDCVDRHSAYTGLISPELVDNMELELVKNADMVFTTAKGLYERLSPHNKNTQLIPNGANYELFSKASQEGLPRPSDMENIEGKILCFLGALQDCIEYSYVEAAAKAHPEWSFVFIGSKLPGIDLSALESLNNSYFLGLKPHDELPQYLQHADVCLNIFSSGALSKDVSPLKFYEYLCTGKPIVSTAQPQQVLDYEDVIYIANSPEEFINRCQQALNEQDNAFKQKRMEYGKNSSWDARVETMTEHLVNNGIF